MINFFNCVAKLTYLFREIVTGTIVFKPIFGGG